jgi:hypothetical protein
MFLFVPPDKWRAFVHERTDRHLEPDLQGRSVIIWGLPLRNVAVLEKTVAEEHRAD